MRTFQLIFSVILCLACLSPVTAHADFRFGERLIVEEGCTIDDAVCIGDDVLVYGTVKKSAVSFGGDIVVKNGGTVKKDAVSIGGDIIVRNNAVIREDAVTFGGNVRINRGGKVRGESVEILETIQNEFECLAGDTFCSFGHNFDNWCDRIPHILFLGPFTGLFGVFGFLLISVILVFKLAIKLGIAALITHIFPNHVHIMAESAHLDFWKALIVGLAGIIAIPFVFLFLLVSILGIPVLPLFIGFLFLGYLFGSVGVALCAGRLLPIGDERSDMRNALLGVLAIGLIRFFPLLGALVGLIVVVLSFGVIILTRFGTRPSVVS